MLFSTRAVFDSALKCLPFQAHEIHLSVWDTANVLRLT